MCLLFHSWSKWSDPVSMKWDYYDNIAGKHIQYIRKVQLRICHSCGLVERNFLEE